MRQSCQKYTRNRGQESKKRYEKICYNSNILLIILFDFNSRSEEQCRHLVRVNEQRHQEVLSAKTKAKSLESKAKSMILQQVN